MTRLGKPPPLPDLTAGWPIELTRSVVQILGPGGQPIGTGFLVSQQLMATCAHIFIRHDADERPSTGPVTIVFAQLDGIPRTVRIDLQLWRAPDGADIAFLRLDEPLPTEAQPLVLGSSRGVTGHRVKTFGFPANAPRRRPLRLRRGRGSNRG
jgi:hypothetical protein